MSEPRKALPPAVNAKQRQQMGRYLYRIHDDATADANTGAWLKLQQQGIHAQCEQSFLHELQCYREIQALSQAKAYSILLDFEIIDPDQYFVIDPTQGFYPQGLRIIDSAALFATAPLHLDHVLQVFFQSLRVVEQLHDLGYLHADLKTAHFRQVKQGCYLIDFEQAVRIEQAATQNITATPRYMAPELFHGQAKSIQSEIYALGVIWSAWLGQPRVQPVDYLAWAKWHCQDFEVQLDACYADLVPILSGMLSKHCSSRYGHIREIKQALTRFL